MCVGGLRRGVMLAGQEGRGCVLGLGPQPPCAGARANPDRGGVLYDVEAARELAAEGRGAPAPHKLTVSASLRYETSVCICNARGQGGTGIGTTEDGASKTHTKCLRDPRGLDATQGDTTRKSQKSYSPFEGTRGAVFFPMGDRLLEPPYIQAGDGRAITREQRRAASPAKGRGACSWGHWVTLRER